MARHTYVRTGSMWMMGRYKIGASILASLVSGSVSCWDAATGGTRYADLLDATGRPVDRLPVDADGYLPEQWQGPDGIGVMWLDGGTGTRIMAVALEIDTLATHVAATDPHPQYLRGDQMQPGDLWTAGDSGPLRLPVGATDGDVLTVDSSQPGGLIYASPVLPETGWRDLSAAVLFENGYTTDTQISLNRVGSTVWCSAPAVKRTSAASGYKSLLVVPHGFRAIQRAAYFRTLTGNCFGYSVGSDLTLNGADSNEIFSVPWPADDPWPTTLPGTPA